MNQKNKNPKHRPKSTQQTTRSNKANVKEQRNKSNPKDQRNQQQHRSSHKKREATNKKQQQTQKSRTEEKVGLHTLLAKAQTEKSNKKVTQTQAPTSSPVTIEDSGKWRIGITVGDINGIGIELIIKTFSDERLFKYFTPVIYGSSRVLSYHRKVLKSEHFNYHIISNIQRLKPDVCNVLNCWTEEVQVTIGRANKKVGRYALIALDAAVYDLMNEHIDALITGPVNKSLLNTEAQAFSGHTEYLAQKFEVDDNLMFMVAEHLRVGLVCNHVPISEVTNHITQENILRKLALMHQSLQQDFAVTRPKIAVLGLNPHAGDTGLIGKEEQTIIAPAIEKAKAKNQLVFGPFAADGFFGSGLYKQFDGILAMYHDQGLVPFKTLSFGKGVNFTAGMPYVRTSPDHGTAYDIAGKNIASASSFRSALFSALDILENRQNYEEITANPLQKTELATEKSE